MNRVDYLSAQLVTTTAWRLDPHTSAYKNLGKQIFTTTTYTVTHEQEHRPDLVALTVYGDPSLWWVLAQYNGLINSLAETLMGLVLKVPDRTEIDAFFNQTQLQSRTGNILVI